MVWFQINWVCCGDNVTSLALSHIIHLNRVAVWLAQWWEHLPSTNVTVVISLYNTKKLIENTQLVYTAPYTYTRPMLTRPPGSRAGDIPDVHTNTTLGELDVERRPSLNDFVSCAVLLIKNDVHLGHLPSFSSKHFLMKNMKTGQTF